jgi:putative DNA primase/helicase
MLMPASQDVDQRKGPRKNSERVDRVHGDSGARADGGNGGGQANVNQDQVHGGEDKTGGAPGEGGHEVRLPGMRGKEATLQYLHVLTGCALGRAGWQVFGDKDSNKAYAWNDHGNLTELEDRLAKDNANGCGVFLFVNELDGAGYTSANVKSLRAAFADLDGVKVDKYPVEPSFIVHSAHGDHPYWLLEPGEPVKDFRALQKGIAERLGSDPVICNPSRVMRVPGFFHNKADPVMVTITPISARHHTIASLAGAFKIDLKSWQEFGDMDDDAFAPIIAAADRQVLITRCRSLVKKCPPAISGSNGDSTTYKTAAIGGDFGLSKDEYLPILAEWNKTCKPPWSDGDLKAKLDNATRYRKRPKGCALAKWAAAETDADKRRVFLTPRRDSEADLSVALVESVGNVSDLRSTGAAIVRYAAKSGIWETLPDADLIDRSRRFDGATVMDDGRPGELKMSWNKAQGVYKFALSYGQIRDEHFFETKVPGVAFRNGFVKVTSTGCHPEPHSRDNRARHAMPYDFDPDTPAPVWEEMLGRLFANDKDADDKKALLQEFVGACVCGVATEFDRCVVLTGHGGNGKSTFQFAITDNLFPPDAIGRVTPQRWGLDHYLSGLSGKLINVVPELPSERILASETFKGVITGDVMQARDLYHTAFSFKPVAGHLFACNELPGTADYTDAFWDRFFVVQFNNCFRGAAGWKSRGDIIAELKKEAPGIMAWALHGAVRLLGNRHYTKPDSNAAAKEEWKKDVDNVSAWLSEQVETTANKDGSPAKTPIRDSYGNYKEWCIETSHKPVASNTFGKRLTRLGHPSFVNNSIRYHPFFVRSLDKYKSGGFEQ